MTREEALGIPQQKSNTQSISISREQALGFTKPQAQATATPQPQFISPYQSFKQKSKDADHQLLLDQQDKDIAKEKARQDGLIAKSKLLPGLNPNKKGMFEEKPREVYQGSIRALTPQAKAKQSKDEFLQGTADNAKAVAYGIGEGAANLFPGAPQLLDWTKKNIEDTAPEIGDIQEYYKNNYNDLKKTYTDEQIQQFQANDIATAKQTAKEKSFTKLIKTGDSNRTQNDQATGTQKILYTVGTVAGSIPGQVAVYGVANKVLGGMKVFQGINNPIVKSIVMGQIADTLISTPQVVANSTIEGKNPQDVLLDVLQDQAINLAFNTAFAGFENRKAIKEAFSNFNAKKITEQELETAIKNQTDIMAKEALNNVDNVKSIETPQAEVKPIEQTTPKSDINPSQTIQGGTDSINSTVAKEIDSPTFTEKLPHANETVTEHGKKYTASEYADKIDKELPDNVDDLKAHIGELEKEVANANGSIPINIQFFAAKRKLERILMNVPDGMKARRVAERVVEDINQPIDTRKAVAEDFKSFYEVYSDKKAVAEATDYIAKNGNNVEAIVDRLQNGKFTKGDVATAIQIYDNIKVEQPKKAAELLAELSIRATEAGQVAQAFSLLKTMGDDGFDYMVKRQIEKINRQMSEKFGKKFTKIEMDGKINDLLAKRASATTDEAKELIADELSNYIGSKIPSSNLDKIIAFRHLAMLANPKTHLRNILGNFIMGNVAKGKDYLATGLEKVLVKKGERTKFINWRMRNPEIISTVDKETNEYIKRGMGDVKFESGLPVRQNQKTFTSGKENPNIIDKGIQKAMDINYALLEGEDKLFSRRHFSNALGQFMSARGLKEATPEAIEYATKQAQKLTFRDASKLATAITMFAQGHTKGSKALRIGVDALIPFKKTPINIAKRTVEYSPFGLVKGIYDRAIQVKAGKITAAAAVDEIAAGLTGTGIGILGYILMASGIITGTPDKNAKIASFDKVTGKQPFSIKFGDTYYSYDWASPVGSMLATGAAVFGATKDNQDVTNVFLDATAAEMDSLFNSSVFKNVRDTFAGRYGSTPFDTLKGTSEDYLLSFIPAMSGVGSRTIDDMQRNTTDKSEVKQFTNRAVAKIPVASKSLPIKYDVFGKPLKNANPVNNILNPALVQPKSNDTVINEISKIAKSNTDVLPLVPNKKTPIYYGQQWTIPAKDFAEYSKRLGQLQYDEAKKLIDGTDKREYSTSSVSGYNDKGKATKYGTFQMETFSEMSDDEKADLIRKKYLEAKKIADEELRVKGVSSGWIKK
jgi:hypothetical protein